MANLGDARMAETSYSVIIPCKNGQETIARTLRSLINQSLPPNQIIVVDDASNDQTPQILKQFEHINIIRLNHKYPKNFNRVPKLVNIGISKIEPRCEYLMLSGDDSVYPENYVETLLKRLQRNPTLRIVSGNLKESGTPSVAPQGSGRVFKMAWLEQHLPFPVSCTWESGILFKALMDGGAIECFNDITFSHIHKYSAYSLRTFGHAMYVLGYFPVFVFGRLAKSFVYGGATPRHYVFYQLLGYVEYCLASPEAQDDEVGKVVRKHQKQRIMNFAKRTLRD